VTLSLISCRRENSRQEKEKKKKEKKSYLTHPFAHGHRIIFDSIDTFNAAKSQRSQDKRRGRVKVKEGEAADRGVQSPGSYYKFPGLACRATVNANKKESHKTIEQEGKEGRRAG